MSLSDMTPGKVLFSKVLLFWICADLDLIPLRLWRRNGLDIGQ